MNDPKSNQKRLIAISYTLSVLAISMFAYSTFLSKVSDLQKQGIYWFGIAAVCALLPTILPLISKLKVLDLEVEFKEKLESVEKRIAEIEDAFVKSFEGLRREEQELPLSFIEQRNRQWDRYDEYMQSLDKEQRFEAQRENSLFYLKKFGLSVRDLKERLAKLGYYQGYVNDDFSRDLPAAIEHFQRINNMRHIDGIFGELTFEKMAERLTEIAKRITE